MGLSDFERELAADKAKESGSRHRDDSEERRHRHRHKRRRHETDEERDERRRRKHERRERRAEEERDQQLGDERESEERLQRDDWMHAPSALDVDYVQRPQREAPRSAHASSSKKDYELKLHENELNHQLRDVPNDDDDNNHGEGKEGAADKKDPADVDYTFGDAGSQWRMTKLRAVYRQADESGRPVEAVALDRYADLRAFDDAREEETELDRRTAYRDGYRAKLKPTGELFRARGSKEDGAHQPPPQQHIVPDPPPTAAGTTVPLDQTALNRLKAQMMKAKLRRGPDAARLEAEYDAALAVASAANRAQPDVVVLGPQHTRLLDGRRATTHWQHAARLAARFPAVDVAPDPKFSRKMTPDRFLTLPFFRYACTNSQTVSKDVGNPQAKQQFHLV
ncbi:MAG: hypothetical protein INR71_02690, partial [Terriglobus roseus]|nr:hypothetical protein [Terriglobus roseus]